MSKQKETFIPSNQLNKSAKYWSETNQTLTLGGTVLSKDQLKKNFSQSQLKFLKTKVSQYIETTLQSNDVSHLIKVIMFAFLPAVLKSDAITIQMPPLKNVIFKNKNYSSVKWLGQSEFRNLKELNIGYQNISSIEVMAFVDAPQLTVLRIDNNLITHMGGLIKSYFPRLEKLSMKLNPIMDIGQIYRMSHYLITQYIFERERIINPDYEYLARLCPCCPPQRYSFQGLKNDKLHDYKFYGYYGSRTHLDKRFLTKIIQAGKIRVVTFMQRYEKKLFQKLRQSQMTLTGGIEEWE